jgi:hypothetical protein
MPFTVSHAAVAAPLWRLSRQRLVLSALVVGSMAPDFEYLVHLSARRTIGHTLPGLVVLCLPLSLAALVLWHRLIAPAWGPLLGRGAPPSFAFWPWSRLAAVAASAFLGSLSHVVWDAFTHEHGLVVRHAGLLAATVAGTGVHVYSLLQYASSAAGAVFLAVWAHQHLGGPVRRVSGGVLVPLLAATGGACLLGGAANALRVWSTAAHLSQWLAAVAIGAMAAGTLAVLVLSACLPRRLRITPVPPPRRSLVRLDGQLVTEAGR